MTEKSYYLENVNQSHQQYPRTFLVPTPEELQNVKVGDWVRVFFVLKFDTGEGCRAERMWLVVSKMKGDAFKGYLTNQPVYIKDLAPGEEVSFRKENIATVRVEAIFDEAKFALITRKAFEMKAVNWVLKSDELQNEDDSGWQLFYGDETEKYLDEPGNVTPIRLSDVLAFEPRLEEVFGSTAGTAFEWNESATRFTEAEAG